MGVYASLLLSNGCGSLRGSQPTEPTSETSVNLTESRRPLRAVAKRRHPSFDPPASKDANRFGAVFLGWSVSLTINAYKNKD
jgi:hypothetical protein